MGTYFNPADQLPKVARKLTANDYKSAITQLTPDEVLFGYGDNFRWKVAPYLDSQDEYEAFHSQYRQGYMRFFDLYAMPKNTFKTYFNFDPR